MTYEEPLMEKPADTQYPIHDLLRRRWSPRAYDERPVEPDKLRSLFEAARWAPSSNNEQPWRFIVGSKENPTEYTRLLDCLVEGNKKWAYRAPVLVLSVAKLTFDDGSPNRHAFHDTGMAAENLVLQATALGLQAHQMAGFDVEKARKELAIPEGYDPVAMITIGYFGDVNLLSDRARQNELSPRSRRPAGDSVFTGTWGKSSTFLVG
jgi:nitroreductase